MKRICVGLLIILSLLFAGCNQSTPHQEEAGTIYIGYIGGLTGPAAYLMTDALHGAQVAAREANEQGGIEIAGKFYNVEIVSYDDELTPAKSVTGLRKLKDDYDISVVVSHPSATIMSLLEINEELEVIVTGFYTHLEATKLGNKLVLRHTSPLSSQDVVLVKAAAEVWGVKTYAAIGDITDYGKSHIAAIENEFEKYDVKRVGLEWVDPKETDFRTQLTKIKASNPEIIVVAGYDEVSTGTFIQSRELGITTPFFFTPGLSKLGIETIGLERLDGSGKVLVYSDLSPQPIGVKNYYDLFDKVSGDYGWKEPAAVYGAVGYENVWAILFAMQKAGTISDPYAIRAAALEVLPLPEEKRSGGILSWDDTGEGVMELNAGLFENGNIKTVFEYKGLELEPIFKLYSN